MDTNTLQPFYDMLALLKSGFMVFFFLIGIFAGFKLDFFVGLLCMFFSVVFLAFFGYTLSHFSPGLMSDFYHYIKALGLGFLAANIVKRVTSILWGY
ncbi:hypothetical protein [Planktothrix mougeotii]|uniref:Uncharacterized protein n=1 Tax=Planktothrix mougeotii LEGE 06226 TaxID=1828728 RepID=A0ABR9UIV0_9CYAN|nr:hypothetical protein [Planktothrix mougeotii]MBE9145756.1 hypothetical protein [Planktothrix mougeotii LEGE 06226]